MLRIKEHGGKCCGMRNVYDFPSYSPNRKQDVHFKNFIENGFYHRRGQCMALEVILTVNQAKDNNFFWSKQLKKNGFKLLDSWININTNRRLYLFVKRNGRNVSTKWWDKLCD